MANNKVQLADGTTLIDLTSDTVTPQTMLAGMTAHAASGEQITGTLRTYKILTSSESNAYQHIDNFDDNLVAFCSSVNGIPPITGSPVWPCWIRTTKITDSILLQEVLPYHPVFNGQSNHQTYIRVKQNGTWSIWNRYAYLADIDNSINSLINNMKSLSWQHKSTGALTFNQEATGFQRTSTKIFVAFPLPYCLANTNYTLNVTRFVLYGVTVIDVSNVTVEHKDVDYIRVSVTYNGTVNTPYLCDIIADIIFS